MHLVARVLVAQQVCGEGQGTAVVGIDDQELFLNTKGTHVLSVDDESVGGSRLARPAEPGCGR
ncbi:hypothetical protein GCM10027067_31670 [Pseudactinotalea suaedae]